MQEKQADKYNGMFSADCKQVWVVDKKQNLFGVA